MAFDTVHQILITHCGEVHTITSVTRLGSYSHLVYTYTITHWGDPPILEQLVW